MMYGSLDEKTLPTSSPHSSPAQATTWARVAKTAILLAAVGLLTVLHQPPPKAEATSSAEWIPCGAGLECASVTVPLDWSAGFTTGGRNVSVALARLPASDKANKIGSLFMNPGGPGASGTAFVHQIGSTLSTLVQGRYDIVGFDPRGVNPSRPRVSCFPNALSEVMFVEHETLYFNTPVNWTHENHSTKHGQPELVAADVYRQAQINVASDAGLKALCLERSGDVVAFMGTANVVRDIDYISQLLDGPGSRVNFWGFSYGTVLGQYLTAMLPPHRLGRVAIDGVISASLWSSETDWISKSGEDVDAVVEGFATTCIAAGPERCALASLGTSSAILAAIDALIDRLYYSPSAVTGMSLSGFVGKSVHVQLALFTSTYSIALWPILAQVLAKAIFDSNEAPILNLIMAGALNPAKLIDEPDSLMGLYQAVLCADSPFNFTLPPPTADTLAALVISSESDVSRRLGSFYVRSGGCHHWPVPSQSFFGGSFKFAKDALDTPLLLLSQLYDPVTPIRGAKSALKNFGSSNARLVEQRGYGHAAISQGSLCTALILRKFFVDGVAPFEAHSVLSTSCPPYAPFLGFAGVAAAMVFSTVGAAYGTSKAGIGISGMGTLRPDLIMKSLIPVVMAGIIAVYGLVVSVLIIGGLSPDEPYSLFAGFIHLAAGLSCGLTGLAAGHAIGIVGDACARAYMFQSKIFVAMVLMLIFAEVIGLYGLIVALILNTRAGEGVCY